MTEAIRIGIAGAGFAARFHLKGIRRVYGVPLTISGVISNTPASRQKFAQEFGVKSFDTLEELCDASDVIDVCTPGSSHETVAVEALNRGKHVIIEKPISDRMASAAAAAVFGAVPTYTPWTPASAWNDWYVYTE